MNVSTKSCLWCHISIFPLSTGSQHFSSSQPHKPCLMLLRATFWPSNSPLRHPSFSGATNATLHLWIFHVQCTSYMQAKLICGIWVWLLLICQTPFSHRLGPNSSHATPIQRNWNISNIFHNCQSPISSFSPLALNQIMRDSFSTEIFPNQGLQDIK